MGNDPPHNKITKKEAPQKVKRETESPENKTSLTHETLISPISTLKAKKMTNHLSQSTHPNRKFQPQSFTRSSSIKDNENQVNFTIFHSKDGHITEERLCLKILLTETIENMKQELNKKFHLGKDLDSLLYDLKSENKNERKVENPGNICEKSKIEIFGKTPHFIISSLFSFSFSSPLDKKIILKRSLCVEINEIKEHFSKEYDVPKEEIILICQKSPKPDLSQDFLLDYQIERSNEKEIFLEKKHGEPNSFIIDFRTKIELKLRFNSSEEIYKVSSLLTIKTLKKKLANRFLGEEYENQIWTLTFPEERKEILNDDCQLSTLKLPKIEISISKISRNELDFQDTMKETLRKYPSGVEKDILHLYFDLNLEKMTKLDFQKISEQLKEVEKTIIQNSPYAEIFKDYFKELYLILESRDTVILKKEIIKMFEKIDPINLESLNRKLKISEKEAKNMISDERIFILLGTSGVGKSTTACYLSKCHMVKEDGNIIVKPNTLPLAPCKIGRSIHSETRGFHPFVVSLKEYKGLNEKRMILCDTAGFKDTEGPDLDLLNSLSITRSVEYASEVKPIVVISESSCGARFEGVKALACSLLKMIPSAYYLLSCDYFFTKVSIFDVVTIRKKIESLCEDLEKESPERNKDLIKILKDMKEKVKILDPIEKKPQIEEIISSWMNSQFIPKHEEMFRNSFSFETIEIVRKQIEIIKKAIRYYVKINDYDIVDFKLRQLNKISKLLPYQFKEVYMEGIKEVSNFLNESLMVEVNSLISKMTATEGPTKEEIQSALKLKSFELWESVRRKHLKNELYNRDFITEYFMEKMQSISNSFQQIENLSQKEPTIFLSNMYAIFIEFPDSPEFGKFIKTKIDNFHQEIKDSISTFESLLEKNQLKIIESSLGDIEKALLNIPEKYQKLNLYEEAKNEVIDYYENFENPIAEDEEDDEEQVLNYVAEKEKFQRLITRLKKLEIVENCKELNHHIPKAIFTEMKTYVCKQIGVFLDKIKKSIIENKNYNEINKILHDMNDILVFADEIKQSSETVFKMIKNTFKQLKHFIIRVQSDVSEVLNDLHLKKEKIDYNKLNKALDCLIVNKDLINKIIPGANYIFSEIDEEIDCYFADKKDEFDQIDLHYRNHEGLPEIKEILISLSKIRKYDKLFEKVKKYFDGIMEEFKKWIKSNFRKIKREIEKDFESHDFENLEKMLLYLKSLDGLIKNKLVNNYLPELDFNVDEVLDEFRSNIKQKIKNFQENFLDEKKQNLEFFVRNLAKVEECSKFSNLSKELNLEKIYKDLIKKLTNKYNNLKTELMDAHELENFSDIFAELNECKIFVDFDNFLEKNYRFQDLFVEQDGKLRELLAKLVKRAEGCIQKNDFQGLLEIFEKFNFEPPKMKQLYTIILKNKETIKYAMRTHFRFLKEKIEMWFETNSNIFPENSELNLIYPDLKILKEAYTYLLNYDSDLKKNWDFFIDSFFTIYTSRLKIIETELNAHKFSLFEQHLKDFKYTMNFLIKLDKKKAEEIGKKVENLESLRSNVLNAFLEQVRILNLENLDIEYSPPKERYDELRTLSGDIHHYQNSFKDYSKILVEKIQERIEMIKKVSKEDQRGKFLKMKEWLKFMPEFLSNHFLEKIEEDLKY